VYKAVRIICFILAVVVLGVIGYYTFGSDVQLAEVFTGSFKLGHFLAYTALGFLIFICYADFARRRWLGRNILPMLSAVLLATLVGCAGELCQPFFGRTFALYDMFIDAMGSLTGAVIGLVCVVLMSKIEKRISKH
jgi:VanZ family protein